MKFMMLMIPAVYQPEKRKDLPADFAPKAEDVEAMMKYNERLANEGVLLAADGLHPLEEGSRVSFRGGKGRIIDGPFAETKEVLGGYWVIEAPSREAALEWARRCPAADGDVIEVRQIFDTEQWPEDAREAARNDAVDAAIERGKSR